jgi:2-keto-4-pentenoate hydratase
MNTADIRDAARALLAHQARLREAPADSPRSALRSAADILAGDLAPPTATDAYAVQGEMIRQAGAVAGWKVGGATAPEPNCAPVFASVLFEDGHSLPFTIAPETEFECEVAFTIGRDLPQRAQPYDESEVAAAISGTRAAVELLAPRFAAPATTGERLITLADGLGCGALVVGKPTAGFIEVDCATQPVKVETDGVMVLERLGGNAARRLLPLLCWLANHLAGRGIPLRAGQTVTTGSWTGARAWGPARALRAEFAGIGQVEVRAK